MVKKIISCLFIFFISFQSVATDKKAFAVGNILSFSYHLPLTERGWSNLIFPMSIQRAPNQRSYFYAQQFQFMAGAIGYIGARPWMGQNQLSLAFSVFGKEVKVVSKALCRPGADDGPGISCSKIVSYQPGKKFYLTVQKSPVHQLRWRGFFSRSRQGERILIGEWEVPKHWGNLLNHQRGFVEYYMPVTSCLQLPKTDVTFYPPVNGRLEKPIIKFCELCAQTGGVPMVKENTTPDAYHFVIKPY